MIFPRGYSLLRRFICPVLSAWTTANKKGSGETR